MTEQLSGDNVIIAILASYVIQFLKNSPAKWLSLFTNQHPGILRGFSALIAALSTAGIYYTFDGGVLTITGLTVANIVGFTFNAVAQFVMQHSAFKMLISNRPKKIQYPDLK